MEGLDSPSHTSNTKNQQLVGKRLYRPGVLAAYCALASLPWGFCLYGLNVYRRGNFWMGRIMLTLSALGIIGMSVAAALGIRVHGLRLMVLNVAVGIGLVKAERITYQKAILNGAIPTKWWLPLLFIAANILAVFLISWLVAPDEGFF